MQIEVATEELRKYKLFIGTPMYGVNVVVYIQNQQMI